MLILSFQITIMDSDKQSIAQNVKLTVGFARKKSTEKTVRMFIII